MIISLKIEKQGDIGSSTLSIEKSVQKLLFQDYIRVYMYTRRVIYLDILFILLTFRVKVLLLSTVGGLEVSKLQMR